MSWDTVKPILPDLVLLQARMERLRLIDKLRAAEMHFKAAGMDTTHLQQVRQALLAKPMSHDKPMFMTPASPPKQADGTQRLRYLMVSEPRRV